ncbi:unnamed protein product [Mytilus edulis]|uniref:Fibrinogen C-terminal domain-containing protein n=1 Tax=Mytilus edulis TaxID=6550 RepID=A0A8S3RGC9_MYTED|nr:unnamed protein product [Mytilus edulis]
MVTSTKSQIGKNFHDTKRTPSAGNFKYGRGNMINNWCPVAKPKDCGEIDPAHCQSGVYTIFPPGLKPFDVYCKLTNQGKAWTVIQRRFDGKIDFYRTWKEYEHGFGNLKGEHWLGNDKIHILTSGGDCLTAHNGNLFRLMTRTMTALNLVTVQNCAWAAIGIIDVIVQI